MALNLGSPWISHPIPILFKTSSISSNSRSSLFLLLLTRYSSGIYALKPLSLYPSRSPSSSHPNNFHTRPRASSRAREDENPENSSSELLNDDLLRRVLGAKDADEALEMIAENCGRNGGVVGTEDCCSIIGAALDRNNTDLAFSVFSAMRSSFDDGGEIFFLLFFGLCLCKIGCSDGFDVWGMFFFFPVASERNGYSCLKCSLSGWLF